mmetsp:Transcript_25336/g.29341  ORF Transcript_25336/g.29341 Transcript_25336/m.29341 type:complete len:105 (-) Transcript_25336:55-369(-)
MAQILGKYSNIYMQRRAAEAEKEFLSRKLTAKDLQQMDREGDGAVSYSEFLVFMLHTMGKVEKKDIEQLEQLYLKLDADHDGNLTMYDLFKGAYGNNNREREIC